VTRDKDYQQEGCLIVHSLEEGIELAKSRGEDELFISGGGEIYRQALPTTQRLYLSIVDYDGPADIFFPEYNHYEWGLTHHEKHDTSKTPWELKILEKE